MGDRKVAATGDGNKRANVIGSSLPGFFLQLPEKLGKCVKSHLSSLTKDVNGTSSTSSILGKDRISSIASEVNLDQQLQAWKENPVWHDQSPNITVSVPKGSLCSLNVEVNVGLPPDAVYNIVTDPDNSRVFKNIKEVKSRKILVDEGSRQVVEVEQAALWKFLWWSGTISVHVLVDQNRENHTMKFKQLKAGFMDKFEGCWRVEPLFVDERSCESKPKSLADYISCSGGRGRIGSRVHLEQLIQPSIVPPPPISWYLRGITTRTTEMLINDLLAEAARIRGGVDNTEISNEKLGLSSATSLEDGPCDIKKRWAMHRRNSKQCHKRLISSVK